MYTYMCIYIYIYIYIYIHDKLLAIIMPRKVRRDLSNGNIDDNTNAMINSSTIATTVDIITTTTTKT